jgi:hypothetical protein
MNLFEKSLPAFGSDPMAWFFRSCRSSEWTRAKRDGYTKQQRFEGGRRPTNLEQDRPDRVAAGRRPERNPKGGRAYLILSARRFSSTDWLI